MYRWPKSSNANKNKPATKKGFVILLRSRCDLFFCSLALQCAIHNVRMVAAASLPTTASAQHSGKEPPAKHVRNKSHSEALPFSNHTLPHPSTHFKPTLSASSFVVLSFSRSFEWKDLHLSLFNSFAFYCQRISSLFWPNSIFSNCKSLVFHIHALQLSSIFSSPLQWLE